MRVLGSFLLWLLFAFIIIPFNILDFKFKDVYEGNYDFFQWMRWDWGHRSLIFADIIIVALFPAIFGLEGISYLITTMLCETVFIGIYIRIYQWVNKKRDEKENKKSYVLGWEEGDVYTFQIKGEKKDTFIKDEHEKYIGWWAVFYVDKIIKEDWQVRGIFDEVAEMYLFLTKDKPENAETIQVITPILFNIFNNKKNRYRVKLIETSKRQRPKDLKYLGKCSSFTYPPNEFWQEGKNFSWYLCERDILMGYEQQLKMQGK